jgi:hypothetical protein
LTGRKEVYNPAPAQAAKHKEGRKTQVDAAEYDESFLERFAAMHYDDFRVYMESLPEAERKAIMEALNRAACQQAVKEHHEWLRGGLW